MSKFLVLVSLKCGRHDKRIDITNKTDDEVQKIKDNLVYDKSRFILIKY